MFHRITDLKCDDIIDNILKQYLHDYAIENFFKNQIDNNFLNDKVLDMILYRTRTYQSCMRLALLK